MLIETLQSYRDARNLSGWRVNGEWKPNSFLSNRKISVDDLTPEFTHALLVRADESIVENIYSNDRRNRTIEQIRNSVHNGAFGESTIAQLISQIPGVDRVEFGLPTDYGFDLIVWLKPDWHGAPIKIEVKKMPDLAGYVTFNHPLKYENVEFSARNNRFDFLIAWKLINGCVVPWAIVSSEAFSATRYGNPVFAVSNDWTTDMHGNALLYNGKKYKGKYIQDGNADELGMFNWLTNLPRKFPRY